MNINTRQENYVNYQPIYYNDSQQVFPTASMSLEMNGKQFGNPER